MGGSLCLVEVSQSSYACNCYGARNYSVLMGYFLPRQTRRQPETREEPFEASQVTLGEVRGKGAWVGEVSEAVGVVSGVSADHGDQRY